MTKEELEAQLFILFGQQPHWHFTQIQVCVCCCVTGRKIFRVCPHEGKGNQVCALVCLYAC